MFGSRLTEPGSTKATLFAPRKLKDMDIQERIRACYQHACLRYVSHKPMSNASLRERFAIKEGNYAMASRIIRDTIQAELIRPADPTNKSKPQAKYVPFWG